MSSLTIKVTRLGTTIAGSAVGQVSVFVVDHGNRNLQSGTTLLGTSRCTYRYD